MFALSLPVFAAGIIVLLAIGTFWYSVVLVGHVVGGNQRYGWWTLFPAVMLYAVILRMIIFVSLAVGELGVADIARSMMVFFWIGLLVFTINLSHSAEQVKK
jgi:hypothetical protein